jgi:hypothetical protein
VNTEFGIRRFLEWLRSYFVGPAILGSHFDWLDFPY